jgi:hypothetical protein
MYGLLGHTLAQGCDMLRDSGHTAACAVQGSRTERSASGNQLAKDGVPVILLQSWL